MTIKEEWSEYAGEMLRQGKDPWIIKNCKTAFFHGALSAMNITLHTATTPGMTTQKGAAKMKEMNAEIQETLLNEIL